MRAHVNVCTSLCICATARVYVRANVSDVHGLDCHGVCVCARARVCDKMMAGTDRTEL